MRSADKIFTPEALSAELQKWRARGEKIVFTNGCFDLVHLGHVDYLEKARNLGDKLVLGLNTDASIKGLKGEERPLQDELSRARIMAGFLFVDAVVLFSEPTPYNLINLVQPDILVKGDDYSPENIVGADIVMAKGGVVKTIPFVKGYSTSNIVAKIKNQK